MMSLCFLHINTCLKEEQATRAGQAVWPTQEKDD
jgi:hypothetical protein